MASLGDVFLRILADANGFEADVVKKAGPAADKAGMSLGKRMSKSMGSILASGIGANQLDAATRQLQADTGMTADEAANAEHALAGLYRNNLQGFDAIGAAMAKVHNDLGLTGDAANAATQEFLDFSTATGQDAAGAIAQADDTLDAFNLTADQSGGLLDILIASHQKYGGVISENQATLAKLAPAMTSFGFSLEETNGLLNLFNAAGVDAAKVPQAMAQALKKVKSPEELRQLIRDITNTKDPFERAQKAIALFGNRAGPQLAQALAQGKLDDFVITMDEAKGSTDEAAAAVKSGFGAQFQLLMKNAGGALADFGTQFGPLLIVASQLGPGMLAKIGAGLGGLAGLVSTKLAPKLATGIQSAVVGGIEASMRGEAISTATGKLGDFMGSKLGKGLSVAFAAVAVYEVFDTYNRIRDGLAQQTEGIARSIGDQVTQGTTAQLEQSKAALEQGLKDLNGVWDAGIFSNDARRKLQENLDAVTAELQKRATAGGAAVGASYAAGLASKGPAVYGAGSYLSTQAGKGFREGERQALATGLSEGQQLANGLIAKGPAVYNAASYLLSKAGQAFRQGERQGLTITVAAATSTGRVVRRAEGGPTEAGTPYWVGERGPELFVPKAPGVVVPHDASVAAASTSNVTNITVPMTGYLPVRSGLDIANQLRRLSDFGVLSPRRGMA